MKFKALRKKETKEFVEIQQLGGLNIIFTSELPNPQPITATIDLMKILYNKNLWADVNFNIDDYELVEFEMYEVDIVGADIRNKLSPLSGLVSMVRNYNETTNIEVKKKIMSIITGELELCDNCIKYIANLI